VPRPLIVPVPADDASSSTLPLRVAVAMPVKLAPE
jgi:hypothetical protein